MEKIYIVRLQDKNGWVGQTYTSKEKTLAVLDELLKKYGCYTCEVEKEDCEVWSVYDWREYMELDCD